MNSYYAIFLLYGLNVAFAFIGVLCIKCFHLTVIVDSIWVEAFLWVAWDFHKVPLIDLDGFITVIISLISI